MSGADSAGRPTRGGGAAGNERLTAATAAVLLVLLAVEGATVVRIRPLLVVHVFVGVLLLGPVALKIVSTGYRFARYYLHAAPYRRKGPPRPLMRVLGPLVILSILTVLGSGVALVLVPAGRGPLLQLHKVSFLVWFVLMAAHVVAYVRRLPAQLAADWRPPTPGLPARGRGWRLGLVVGSLLVGFILALAALRLAPGWLAPPG